MARRQFTEAQLEAMRYGHSYAMGTKALLRKLEEKGFVKNIEKNPVETGDPARAWRAEKTRLGWETERVESQERGRRMQQKERASRMESRNAQMEAAERARLRAALKDV